MGRVVRSPGPVAVASLVGLALTIAVEARGVERQFRVVFGANETRESDWDGEVRVRDGRLLALKSWHFQVPDTLEPPERWKCRARWVPARPVARWEPTINAARPGHLQRPGLLVTADCRPNTAVELATRRGTFQFLPEEFRGPGDTQFLLAGKVRVEEVPAETRLSTDRTFDDDPAVAAGGGGEVWVAWIRYGCDSDEVVARRRVGGSWGDVEVLSPEPGDHYRVDLAFDGRGRLWAAWAAQRDGNWDLHARSRADGQWGEIVRVSSGPGPDSHHRLAGLDDGAVVVWQGRGENGTLDIYLTTLGDDGAGTPLRVSPSDASDWEPSVAVAEGRTVHVAWDSYERGNYDVFLRSFSLEDGRAVPVGEVVDVAASPLFEAQPSIDVDGSGRIWIAYHEDGSQWGKDTGYWMKRSGNGLYDQRFVRVVCLTREGRRFPAEAIQSEFPHELREFCDHPRLQIDADGGVWVFFRHRTLLHWSGYGNAAHRAIWELHGSYYTGRRWSPPVYLPNSFGRCDMRASTALDGEGRIWIAWPDDGRVPEAPRGYLPRNANVQVAALSRPAEPTGTPELQPASEAPVFENVVHPDEAEDVARLRSYRATVGGTTYSIVRGDFHRHTDISHDGNADGSLQDAYRYALDAVAFDYLGITDHDYGSNDYDWWRSQKAVDLFYLPGKFIPMYSYERSLRYPNGHRNIVHAVRGVRPLPHDPGERAGRKNTGDILYPHLRDTGGIAMSHTSATGMGTDWRDNDPGVEPVVEIFQGDRNSYEHPGAPLAATDETPELHKGGHRPLGFVWNAWAKGYRLGVQASSDHMSTHCSYCCIYVSEFSREGILDGLRRRHCYGATDNIVVDFRLVTSDREYLMGDVVETAAVPRFRIRLHGTAPLKSIAIVKNNEYVYSRSSGQETITFEYRDMTPSPGESYYYVRLQQVDGHVAWGSPIWIVRPGGGS